METLGLTRSTYVVASEEAIAESPATAALSKSRIVRRTPTAGMGVPYYLYVPHILDPASAPLVVVHGISRNAEEHAKVFARSAESAARILIAPVFSKKLCRLYQKVVIGNCRADLALMTVLDDVATVTGEPIDRVDMFGFSGGAQFAHRFAMLYPHWVGRLALASAGWYTFPTGEEPFPYGIATSSAAGRWIQSNMGGFLSTPTLVVVGEEDVLRDRGLRKERRVDGRQGLTRVERGARWVDAIRGTALSYGIPPKAYFKMLPNCGHQFEDCVENGGLVDHLATWFGN